ncbi:MULTISPECIES: hypothetical protein [Gammaproteobacteria]|nr:MULTISPECIES: hypothetical protein [Bacteria]MCH5852309.1 hypothetical protein [Salmonella enterica]MDK8252258.1 hypothetical protein [Enterococcus faecalis]
MSQQVANLSRQLQRLSQ